MNDTRKCDVCESYIEYDEDGNPTEGQTCSMLGCPHLPTLHDKVDEDGDPLPLDFSEFGC